MITKHAYLIIAHKVDKTLNSLIALLDDSRNDIFLHVDKKNDSFQKTDIRKTNCSNLVIVSRLSVSWGGYSLIECELLLFEMASNYGRYSYYHLLSGQDLPIKSQDYIHNFFDCNKGKEFVNFQSSKFTSEDRIRYYYLLQEKRGRFNTHSRLDYLEIKLLDFQKKIGVRRNKHISFQKGAEWVSVTDCFVRTLLAQKKWIKKTFRFTQCCDEVYKQTFAINFGFNDSLFSQNKNDSCMSMMRLIDWKRGKPYIWRISDKEELMQSECVFARKFDSDVDSSIIDYLLASLR